MTDYIDAILHIADYPALATASAALAAAVVVRGDGVI